MGVSDAVEGGVLALSSALNSEVATAATEQFKAAGDTQGLAVVTEWVKSPNDAQKLQPVYDQVEQHEAEDGHEAIWRMLKNGLKACLYVGSVAVVGLALTAAGVSPTFSFEIVNNTIDVFKSFQKQEETRLAIEYRQQIQLGAEVLKQDDEDASHGQSNKDRPEM